MRLLVIRLSALGDVVHTIPAVSLLSPVHEVSWVVEAPYAEIVRIVAGVEAIPVRLRRWSRSPWASRGEARAAVAAMRGAGIAVDFQGLLKSGLLARLSGAGVRFGFDREAIREKPALLFANRRVGVDRTAHVVDWNRQLAAAVTPNRQPAQERWSDFPADPDRRVEGLAGRIVLLPAAGKAVKQWPAASYRRLVDHFRGRTVVAWGPGERSLAEAVGGDLAPATNLRELAALLRQASVVVGGDTGPLHLAAALGTKVVGLYGPTDPRRNGPYGQIASTIDHFRGSMDSIGADEVIERIEEVLG